MLKKIFKKTTAKKTAKVEKLNKKEMNTVAGGTGETTVHQELHRPPTALN